MGEIKVVDPVTKKHLILLTYKAMDRINYGQMHRAIKEFQDVLKDKYRITFGYKFEDISIYEIWDNELQMDLEAYSCVDGDVINDDHPFDEEKMIYTHQLRLDDMGEDVYRFLTKPYLERKFKNKEIAKVLLRSLKNIKSSLAS